MSQSLREILGKLSLMDEDLSPEDFDPAVMVGELRDKVDSVKWRIDSWLAEAEMLKSEWIAPLERKAKSLTAKAQKLTEYVKHQMIANKFESLPGSLVRIDLRPSPPAVKYRADATAEDYLNYSGLVVQETNFDWNRAKVKDLLKQGESLPFAELTQDKHVRWHVKKGTAE